MAEAGQIQVSRLLDERGLSAFQIKLIVWSFFIVLIDGYDIAAIAFAAPHLVRAIPGRVRLHVPGLATGSPRAPPWQYT